MCTNVQHPFTCIITGPSDSYKSVFTLKLIQHAQQVITPPPGWIMYCYGEYQNISDNYPKVEFREGLPDLVPFDEKSRTLLVLDNLMIVQMIVDLFTKISHHRNLSVVDLTPNIFYKNEQLTLSLYSHYLCLLKKRSRCITSGIFSASWEECLYGGSI